ncbi:DUF3265 domain-containing protein [Vibrio vulnificus]|nr:DUF3265 domain-containing protein [Vibrio vulnificus]
MTRRLRGIHAAWHFWYAVSFSDESGLRKVGLGGTHPLTQRYVLRIKMKHSVFMSLVFLTGCAASQAAPIEVLSYEVDDNNYTLIAISEKS